MAWFIGELVILALVVGGGFWVIDNIRIRKSNKEGKD